MEFPMIKKINTVVAGIIIGIILPVIFYYFFVRPDMIQYRFLGKLYMQMVVKMMPMFLSRCIFPNALLFFIFIWTDNSYAAKGILIVTGIATAILLFVSFVL
jgi:hypothetical protein